MKLHKRLASALVATMVLTSMPVATMASDYDSHWANEAIDKWKNKNIVEGFEDGSFRPSETITNAQFAKILVGLMGYNSTENSSNFTDVLENKWYTDYVTKISAAGVMHESGSTFKPHAPITREEAAYALVNAYKLEDTDVAKTAFTDATKISDWASEAVTTLYNAGYIKGNPDGSFNPKGTLTRAELITMIDRMNSDVVNTSGNYSNDVTGNLVVNTPGVVLKDMTIDGDLYVAEGIGDGELELENVTVNGRVIVEGGGVNSIRANRRCKFNGAFLMYAKNPVRLVILGDKVDVHVMANTYVILTGNFDTALVGAGATLILDNAKVDTITAEENGKAPIIDIKSNSVVQKLVADVRVTIQGTGRLVELLANARGISSTIKPERTSGSESSSVSTNIGNSSDDPWTSPENADRPNNGGTDNPGTDKPGTDDPGTDKPGTDDPGTDKPGTDDPGTDKPGTDDPGTDKPGTDDPGTEDNQEKDFAFTLTKGDYKGSVYFKDTDVTTSSTIKATKADAENVANWKLDEGVTDFEITTENVVVDETSIKVTVTPASEVPPTAEKNTIEGNRVLYGTTNVTTAADIKVALETAAEGDIATVVPTGETFTLKDLDKTKAYVVTAVYEGKTTTKAIAVGATDPVDLIFAPDTTNPDDPNTPDQPTTPDDPGTEDNQEKAFTVKLVSSDNTLTTEKVVLTFKGNSIVNNTINATTADAEAQKNWGVDGGTFVSAVVNGTEVTVTVTPAQPGVQTITGKVSFTTDGNLKVSKEQQEAVATVIGNIKELTIDTNTVKVTTSGDISVENASSFDISVEYDSETNISNENIKTALQTAIDNGIKNNQTLSKIQVTVDIIDNNLKIDVKSTTDENQVE